MSVNSAIKVSSNTLILNEIQHVDDLIANLIDANVDEILFLDGGSTDGTFEALLKYEKKYSIIRVYRWPQLGGRYVSDFNEKDRRNFLIKCSLNEYILYIDADERIDKDFKSKVTKLLKKGKIIDALSVRLLQYWDGNNIRLNTSDDLNWVVDQLRIFRRSNHIKFNSWDRRGLHCFLTKFYMRMIKYPREKRLKKIIIWFLYRFFTFPFINVVPTDIFIFHYHYRNLDLIKENDLRNGDIINIKNGTYKYVFCNKIESINYNRNKEKVICLSKVIN